MHVLVAGATGSIGRPLLRRLIEAGHEVTATTRSPARAQTLAAMGATPVVADVLDRNGLLRAVQALRVDAVISQLTALKKPPMRHRDMALTNRLRTEGTHNLLAAAHETGARRFVTQSMMFGYGFTDAGGRPYTEGDAFPPPGGRFRSTLEALRENEAAVFDDQTVDGIALRYALFYGVGAGDDDMVDAVRKRRLPVLRHSQPLSWVYIDDAATAAVAALERGVPGEAYNIADDSPVSWTGMFREVASAVGAKPPRLAPRWLLKALIPYLATVMTGGVTISNDKAKRQLGWSPAVPSYREGVRLIAAAHASRPAGRPTAEAGRVGD